MHDLHFMKIDVCLMATGVIKSGQRKLSHRKSLLNRMEYKGYIGHFTYDEDLDLFEGKVTNVEDLIIFHGKSINSLRFAFQDAINDHLTWCEKIGKEPEKPFSLPIP
jgi:hypothetical protein